MNIEKPLQNIRIHSHCKIGSVSRCLLVLYVIIVKISVQYRTVQYMLRTTAIVLLLSDWYFFLNKYLHTVIVWRPSLGTGFVWFGLRALPEQVEFFEEKFAAQL